MVELQLVLQIVQHIYSSTKVYIVEIGFQLFSYLLFSI